jgi:hypothetical protein
METSESSLANATGVSRSRLHVVTASAVLCSFVLAFAVLTGNGSARPGWSLLTSRTATTPLVSLGIAGTRLSSMNTNQIVVGIPQLNRERHITICAIPFTLANEGRDARRYTKLNLRFPSLLRRKAIEGIINNNYPVEMHHSINSNGKFDYSSYEADEFRPNSEVEIDEPFFAERTVVNVDTSSVSKDGVNIFMPVGVLWSVKFDATLSISGENIQSYNFDIAFVPTHSFEATLSMVNQHFIEEDLKRTREDMGFVRYLIALAVGVPKKYIFIIFQEMV